MKRLSENTAINLEKRMKWRWKDLHQMEAYKAKEVHYQDLCERQSLTRGLEYGAVNLGKDVGDNRKEDGKTTSYALQKSVWTTCAEAYPDMKIEHHNYGWAQSLELRRMRIVGISQIEPGVRVESEYGWLIEFGLFWQAIGRPLARKEHTDLDNAEERNSGQENVTDEGPNSDLATVGILELHEK